MATSDVPSARSSRVAQVAAALAAAIAACALGAALVAGPRFVPTAGSIAFVLPVGGLLSIGALLAVRRSRNLVGWLCLLAGVLASFAISSGAYVELALGRPDSLPALAVVGWFSIWLGDAWVLVLLAIPLVFPDGRLPSDRWRPAAFLVATLGIGMCVASALDPSVDQWQVIPYNPLGVDLPAPLFELLDSATTIAVPGLLVTSVTAMIVRFRRSRGVERLQLMWLVYAFTLVALLLVGDAVVRDVVSQQTSDVVFGIAYGMLPVAVAVAVLRYRLYDIERVIRRTVVYALVTAALGTVYAGSTIVAGNVFSARRSDLVVAISTLAAAALFRPIHRRIQTTVDRRYNRQRYDAQRTVEAFNAVVREELDAEKLTRQLLDITRSAVQPTRASMWYVPAYRGTSRDREGTGDSLRASRTPFVEA